MKPRYFSPWTLHLFEELSDREWHKIEDVIKSTMLAIPPEKGFRRGELVRNFKRPNGPGKRVRGDDSDSISVGRRALAWQAIANHIRLGRIERIGDQIRMISGTA